MELIRIKCVSGQTGGEHHAWHNSDYNSDHYKIAPYGTLIAWAKQLGRQDCASLLAQSLEEEKATDKKLTEMAESKVNRKAA